MDHHLEAHYGMTVADLPMPFEARNFGINIHFEDPTEISFCDDELELADGMRALVRRFGVVLLRNAYLAEVRRKEGQRNIFPSLDFHVDRGASMANQYSLFWRDPFDPAHRAPRSSKTLVIPNAGAYMQARKQGLRTEPMGTLYKLFAEEDVEALFGSVILNVAWDLPPGSGEICMIDNRTVLHASYYKAGQKGYPIGVRYLY